MAESVTFTTSAGTRVTAPAEVAAKLGYKPAKAAPAESDEKKAPRRTRAAKN